MSDIRLIVGLGNPGKEYEFTRHNLGFLVARNLSERLDIKFSKSSFTNGFTAVGKVNGSHLKMLIPMTFMNHSGVAVKQIISHEKFDLKNVLVIADDLNLDFGQIRIRPKGSDGGHNGLNSIIEKLNTQDFVRLRMGIGQPRPKDNDVDYVLGEFTKQEQSQLDDFINRAAECTLTWIKEGINKAMDQFNKKEGI